MERAVGVLESFVIVRRRQQKPDDLIGAIQCDPRFARTDVPLDALLRLPSFVPESPGTLGFRVRFPRARRKLPRHRRVSRAGIDMSLLNEVTSHLRLSQGCACFANKSLKA